MLNTSLGKTCDRPLKRFGRGSLKYLCKRMEIQKNANEFYMLSCVFSKMP